jgi:hypothetical protein
MNLLKKIFKSRKLALQQGVVMRSLPERGCCMGCVHWRYMQNGMGECKILKQYTDEGFDCKAWVGKGNDA